VAQREGRSIALLFHARGTRTGWVVSRTPRPHFTTGKDPVPYLQEAGLASGPAWTGEKSRPHWDSIPDRPAPNQSLYRLSYPAHIYIHIYIHIHSNWRLILYMPLTGFVFLMEKRCIFLRYLLDFSVLVSWIPDFKSSNNTHSMYVTSARKGHNAGVSS